MRREPQTGETAVETGVGGDRISAVAAPALDVPQRMLALQQRVGNAAFGRMVARWAQAEGRTLAREDLPTEAEIKEAEAWAATGPFVGKDLTPGAGGAGLGNAPGGFDAAYDPSQDELTITMRCAVDWVDGIGADGKAAKGLEKQLENIKKL